MNVILVFFAYDLMAEVILKFTGHGFSPFWFALEGAVIGGISTYFGVEGLETLQDH